MPAKSGEHVSCVYVVHFPDANAIKIGCAQFAHRRLNTISKDFGLPDYENGYLLRGPCSRDIHKIEKKLQKSVHEFTIAPTNNMNQVIRGSGESEFFEPTSMSIILIELFKVAKKCKGTVISGIPRK
ncbi:MAG: GIY-YIG nuclease family protein [Methylophaga sp.]|nr:GIY-YIG nuclease family protein [Methylophaga sp.]